MCLVLRLPAVFRDADDEFGSLAAVKRRLEDWKARQPGAYRDAYMSVSAPALFAPFVRMELLKWRPLHGGDTGGAAGPTSGCVAHAWAGGRAATHPATQRRLLTGTFSPCPSPDAQALTASSGTSSCLTMACRKTPLTSTPRTQMQTWCPSWCRWVGVVRGCNCRRACNSRCRRCCVPCRALRLSACASQLQL